MADPDSNSYTANAAAQYEKLIADCSGTQTGPQGYAMGRGR
jgi:hypothetical protein